MLAKRGWLLLFLGIAGFYLWGLGALPLVGPDEPLYSEVAREMFVRHDFVTTTLGGHTWFEKPSLLYWMMMAGYRVFGVGEYGARIGPALSGLLTGVFVYWIGRTIERFRAGPSSESSDEAALAGSQRDGLARWSTLIWLSSLGAMIFSRGASFDILITMALTGTLAFFVVWYVRSAGIPPPSVPAAAGNDVEGKRVSAWLLFGFYFFIGVSLLAKGLIGIVIPFGIIGIYFLLRRESPPRSFVKSLLWGIPLALAVAAVWYGPIIHRHGWTFIDEFIVQHHFARYLTNKYHHPEPFYFYGPVLIAFSFPWTIFLAAAFISARRWKWRGETALDRLRVFALVWIIVPITFFSLSGSKLTTYILPVLPAVALLIGDRVTRFLREQGGDVVMRLSGLLLIGLVIFGGWYLARGFPGSPSIIVLAALPLAIVGAAALVRPQIRKTLFVLIPIAMFVISAVALKGVGPILARPESVRDLLVAATARGYGATPVVQLHTLERTAEFYAAGRMSYGPRGEPIRLEGATQVIDAARRNGGLVLCFVPLEYESQLTTNPNMQTEVIGDNTRAALVLVRLR
jgi:4-amino-4-deoxy-L-arabinose transferase-like glycosyltransferase